MFFSSLVCGISASLPAKRKKKKKHRPLTPNERDKELDIYIIMTGISHYVEAE